MRFLFAGIFSLLLSGCYFPEQTSNNNHGYGYEYDWMSPKYKFKVRGDFLPESDYELIDFELWYERVNKCLAQDSIPFPDLYIIFVDEISFNDVEYAGYSFRYPPLILVDRYTWDWYLPVVGQHEFAHILSGEFHHNGVVPICETYGMGQ